MKVADMRIPISYCLIFTAVLAFEMGCGEQARPVSIFNMGEKVQAGPLIYTVIEAEWKPELGSGDKVHTPSQRFLLVHLTATNSSAETVSIPSLTLTDSSGQTYNEAISTAEVPSLWGLVRRVKPADTMEGYILFDVAPKSYKLKLESDAGSSDVSMVEMPLQFGLGRRDIPSALGNR